MDFKKEYEFFEEVNRIYDYCITVSNKLEDAIFKALA